MIHAAALLDIWETGRTTTALERVYLLLAAGFPDLPAEQVGELTLGEKEARLLQLRGQLFGDMLDSVVDCPRCAEPLEFELSIAAIGAADYRPNREPQRVAASAVGAGGEEMIVKLLTLNDVRLAQGSGRQLLARSLATPDHSIDVQSLSEATMKEVADMLWDLDPLMQIELSFSCPACGHEWQAVFDPLSYFWTEIERWGERMLRTVHQLAAAYGWSEREILNMSAWRRQRYLELTA